MASKINPIFLNGSNYAVWAPDMETLLKIKGSWHYTKVVIPYPTDALKKISIDGKKDEVLGVIMTYISWEIHFHLSGLDCLHLVWKKMKTLFNQVDKSHIMQLEKELISLDPNSFERMEEYLARVKEIQLKLRECGDNYKKKDGQLIEPVLINLRTPFDVFVLNLHTKWYTCKKDGKDFSFEVFCELLITDHHRFLEEGKLGGKH
jgi:hypothetical protein